MGNEHIQKIGAIYGRVSVDEAAEKGTSLEAQEILGLEYAKMLSDRTGIPHLVKYKLIEQRGASGKDTNRPEYQKLLDLIRARKIDFVTAKEISRLSRSTLDFASLTELCKRNNVAIYIRGLDLDPTTPMGEMLFKLLSVLAEFERKMIVTRITENARARMLTQGHSNGGRTPLGFDVNPNRRGFWIVNEEEIKQVTEVFKIFSEVGSLKATIDESNRLSIYAKNKKPFTYHSLGLLLRNKAYIGIRTVKHGAKDELLTDVELPHGCVLDKKLFEVVQEKLRLLESGRSRKTVNSKRVYLLSGLLSFEDGSLFCGQSGTSKNGEVRYYYWNKSQKLRIAAEKFEEAIENFVLRSFVDENRIASIQGSLNERRKNRGEVLTSKSKSLKAELKRLSEKESRILDQLSNRGFSDSLTAKWLNEQVADMQAERNRLDESIRELDREKLGLSGEVTLDSKAVRRVSQIFESVRQADPVRKREFYRKIFDEIKISKDCQVFVKWRVPEVFTEQSASSEEWRPLRDSNSCLLRERELS